MSLRKKLLERKPPGRTCRLRMADDSEQKAELKTAEYELRVAQIKSADPEVVTEAQAAVDAAREKLSECYEELHLRPVAPADLEALIAAHPPTEEQRAKGEAWNVATFRPALLAACVEGDMSEQDWVDITQPGKDGAARIEFGELSALFQEAIAVNDRSPDGWLGKG